MAIDSTVNNAIREARSRDHARACTVDVFPLVLGRIEWLFRTRGVGYAQEEIAPSNREFVTGPDGLPVDVPLLPFEFKLQ